MNIPDLTRLEREILEVLEAAGRRLKALQILDHIPFGSKATLGNYLASMRRGGLVDNRSDARPRGLGGNALARGTYTQNRPEDVGDRMESLPWQIHRECVVFDG